MSGTQVPAVEAFYHALTGAYAYLAYDPVTLDAVIIDPVLDFDRRSGAVATVAADQMLARIRELHLQVAWLLETHAHADHLSAAAYMKHALGCQVATGSGVCEVQVTAAHMFNLEPEFPTDGSQFEHLWNDGDRFRIGNVACSVIATPGHTPDSVTYLIGDCAFVGDTLFLPYLGTARCDFPGASADQLFRSIRKLYGLPGATRVFVGHDYPDNAGEQAYCSDVRSEQQANAHLSAATGREDFIAFREQRDRTLPLPELFFFALQVNVRAGHFPAEAANGTRQLHVPIHLPQNWPSD
jgi:glyoxylase-like metal-dependent hydrolase (beta-lactamase superfamily II)